MIYLSNWSKKSKKENFDFDWMFSRGEVSIEQVQGLNSYNWENVNLPHDFGISGPFTLDENQNENPQDFSEWPTKNGYYDWKSGSQNGYLPGGIGWYKKNFLVSPKIKGKKIFLEFEGIYRNANIWLNGSLIHNQRNGYMSFVLDITEVILFDSQNILAVRCDNSEQNTSRWYTGSGIYRHCYIFAREKLYIPENQISITTPNVEMNSATVQVNATVLNNLEQKVLCRTVVSLLDQNGEAAGRGACVFELRAAESLVGEHLISVNAPYLWSPESPSLYRAVFQLYADGQLIGEYHTTFGIRKVEFIPGRGLLLNGIPVKAKGVNIHHDLGCLGAAAFDSAILRRLILIKEMGCNAVRLSHNPHAPAVLDTCDRLGILVFAEAFDKLDAQYYGRGVEFEDVWQNDLNSFIERDRNHPSIFIWSVGNEVYQQMSSNDFGVDILNRMIDFVHRKDPTRKVTCALYPARKEGIKYNQDGFDESEPAEMSFHMDVLSCNYTWKFFERDMLKYPQLIPLQSEAVVGDDCLGGWACCRKKGIVGQFFWGGIDYLGESLSWCYKGWYRGFADICGNRRPISYQLQAAYSQKPVLHIGVDMEKSATSIIWNDANLQWRNIVSHWNWAAGDILKVLVYSNQPNVELILNGRSLGRRTTSEDNDFVFVWDVDYEPGTLLAIGKDEKGTIVSHSIITADKKCRVLLVPERKVISADGQDVVHIAAKIVDSYGNVCPYADDLLRFEVKGAGILLGTASGNLKSNENFTAGECSAYLGVAQLVVRPKRERGDILISCKVEGMKDSFISIKAL